MQYIFALIYGTPGIILIGIQKAFDITLNFNNREPMYTNIEERGVHKMDKCSLIEHKDSFVLHIHFLGKP